MFMLKWILEECLDAAHNVKDSVPKEVADAYSKWLQVTEAFYQALKTGK